jgi:outer membrane lipoprotein-sorting protein
MKRTRRFAVGLFLLLSAGQFAQTPSEKIVTAADFLSRVSDKYAAVKDYEASLTVTRGAKGESVQKGKLFYKSPVFLRIDFSSPAGQVMVTDEEKLTIYVPNPKTILVQQFDRKSPSQLALMAGARALSYLQSDYLAAFESTPAEVLLEDGSKEKVTKLLLKGSSPSAAFRQIILSIGDNGMIRRMECFPNGNDKLMLDFQNIRTNQNIPDQRFDYDGPPDAAVINNFLYESDQ